MKVIRIFSVILIVSSINAIALNLDPDFTVTAGYKDKYVNDGLLIGDNAHYFVSIGADMTDYKIGCETASFVEDDASDLMASSVILSADFDLFHDRFRIYCGADLYINDELDDIVPGNYYDFHLGMEAPLFLRSSSTFFRLVIL